MSVRLSLGILLVIAIPALFCGLGSRGITEPDEGRYASIALGMHDSNDWMTPRLYGQVHVAKPPLSYWLIALAYGAGGVNERMARLPAALAAFGTLLLTWSIARRMAGPLTALFSGLVLLTCPMFFAMSRLIDSNMMLTFWITLAVWAAFVWQQDGRAYQRWIFYIALGLAFMTKGPVGMIIALMALLGLRYSARSADTWRPIWSWPGVLVCAVISLWWFIAMTVAHPELWNFFVGHELYDRYFTKVHKRYKPFYFYLMILPAGMLPWLPCFAARLRSALREIRVRESSAFLLAWIILPTIMFSFSGSKLPAYVLPLYPPIALMIGPHIARALEQRKLPIGLLLWLGAIGAIFLYGLLFAGSQKFGWTVSFVQTDLWWLVFLLASAGLLFAREAWLRMLCPILVILILFHFTDRWLARHETMLGGPTTSRSLAAALNQHTTPGDRVVLLNRIPRGLPVYYRHPLILPQRWVTKTFGHEEESADVVIKDDAQVYQWLDSTQRVFVVTRLMSKSNLVANVARPIKELYRDSRYLLVSNE